MKLLLKVKDESKYFFKYNGSNALFVSTHALAKQYDDPGDIEDLSDLKNVNYQLWFDIELLKSLNIEIELEGYDK